MDFFSNFLQQKVPKSGKELPVYYRKALCVSEILLIAYFFVCFFFYPLFLDVWIWFPLGFAAVTGAALWMTKNRGVRENLLIYALLTGGWVFWNIEAFGWSCGVQHMLTLMVVFLFFNIYEKPLIKIACFIVILAYRIGLFSWSLQHTAVYTMDRATNTFYQTINTVGFFVMLAAMCIIFSTSIQDTERQLRIRNQTLYKEAGTDPLTGLPNRYFMEARIAKQAKEEGLGSCWLAMADIDDFKHVNDTYGHTFGDEVLNMVARAIVESDATMDVCRWGGEEFLMLGMFDGDMAKVCARLERVRAAIADHTMWHDDERVRVTITIGAAAYHDGESTVEWVNRADANLYAGKHNGKNQVVCEG
jgi:diguanylate cyclase (GGDEF)-like protein